MAWLTRASALIFKDGRIAFSAIILMIFVILALGAPFFAPSDPNDSDIVLRLCRPGGQYLFGCDLNGGQVLTAMLYGARTSLYVSFCAVFFSMTLGIILGLTAGYFRGMIDTLIMRTVDMIMAFPGILLAMALAAVLGPSARNVIISITITGWTSTARLVRSLTLSLREREYVLACKSMGGSSLRILWKHIFPQTWSTLFVHATFSLSGVILIESSLSFLGLGAQDGAPTWGALLSQGRTVLTEAPHLSVVPGIALIFLILSLNMLGDALRDHFDPRN